jgi:hypothetical protein
MKSILLTCIILVISCGVHAAPLPPADSFRLTVEQLVESSVCRVVQLKFEARPTAEMLRILGESVYGGGSAITLGPILKGKVKEAKLIVASMLGDSNSVCHVATLTQSGVGTETTERGSYKLSPETELKSVIVLTVTNGLYKLNQPLEIGRRNGKPMRLVVGNWSWEEKASKR